MSIACDSKQTTIIAVHGIQGTHRSWLPVVNASSNLMSWHTPDLRGRGNTFRGSSQEDYGLDGFVQDLRASIQALPEHTPYALAGWSLGVSVVLQTCLTLLDEQAPLPQALLLLSGTASLNRTQWFKAQDTPALLQEIAEREQRLGLLEAAGHLDVAWTWLANRHHDLYAQLPRISIPSLIIHGEQDQDCPIEHAHRLAQALPQATLHSLPDAGHSILGSHTELIASLIEPFCSLHTARTAV
ncbi:MULTISPECIES: alpha/beta fold hydrolase [Alcaligenes]|uniref:alpha/beta fold hydrolase n=1 Tax=Alcaligenes TaxID=507 RepID=UPI000397AB1E|nr:MULTISPECIES: alpha/beta hydrolase [Alcaligenes]ERI33641.1 hypothetical protein N879_07305 [Alcaligenes sp. EGD-AK7]HRO21164.1 alpha/beta hydrolase [Alcaligenes phenolicus]HRP12800.1 alpha/beta hydrolase [Alcaligenes phenolicus]